jgi:hypothetical protein
MEPLQPNKAPRPVEAFSYYLLPYHVPGRTRYSQHSFLMDSPFPENLPDCITYKAIFMPGTPLSNILKSLGNPSIKRGATNICVVFQVNIRQ